VDKLRLCCKTSSRPATEEESSLPLASTTFSYTFAMSLQTAAGPINAEDADNFEEIEKQFAVKGGA